VLYPSSEEQGVPVFRYNNGDLTVIVFAWVELAAESRHPVKPTPPTIPASAGMT
jgi:hypothetical protein